MSYFDWVPISRKTIEQIREDLIERAYSMMPVVVEPVTPANQYDTAKVAREQAFIRANFAESYTDQILDNDDWSEQNHIYGVAERFEEVEARESFRKILADAKQLLDAAIGDEPRAQ